MAPQRLLARPLLSLTLAISTPLVTAAAEGVNLAWNACLGDAGVAWYAQFACDTNSGAHFLHGSFVLGSPMPAVAGLEIVLDLRSASPVLPPWWEYKNAGTCRTGSLSTQLFPNGDAVVCEDWAQGQAVGGLASYCIGNTSSPGCTISEFPADWARIKLAAAVPPEHARDLVANQSYFAFALRIDHAKTVGAGACDGCTTPVCIELRSVNVVPREGASRLLFFPASPGSNKVRWQTNAATCPAATPTKASTWGAVKALYR